MRLTYMGPGGRRVIDTRGKRDAALLALAARADDEGAADVAAALRAEVARRAQERNAV